MSTPYPQAPQPGLQPGAPPKPAKNQSAVDHTLVKIIQVAEAAIAAPNKAAAGAVIVNRLAEVLHADRVVLVRARDWPKIETVSGGGAVAQDSNFGYAIRVLTKRYKRITQARVVPDESKRRKPSTHIRKVQRAMDGTSIAWVPLRRSQNDGRAQYALWLERWGGKRSWRNEDLELLGHLAIFFGAALGLPRSDAFAARKRLYFGVAGLALMASMFIPVTNSTTAPARIEPLNPHFVFAPLEGTLQDLKVRPGIEVKEGEALFSYDARVLDKSLEEARNAVRVAKAELGRLEGAAYRDPEARAQLPVQRLEVARSEKDVLYYESQRERADVKAGSAGMVVLDDPDALIGAPLQVGQVVMRIADPNRNKLHLMVPTSDVGLVREGAEVEVRLDRSPLDSYRAKVTRIGFDIVPSDDNVPSVLVEAEWLDKVPGARPGQRGSAKVHSDPTPLGLQIFRKPLITLREISGL